MKYSVIIPTMWKANKYLSNMLPEYLECDHIGEVLIISNSEDTNGFKIHRNWTNISKIAMLNTGGKNLYVNPSWNLGVKQATYDNIILVNDDIVIDSDFDELMQFIDNNISWKEIYGFAKDCFPQKRDKIFTELKLEPIIKREYGFGVFMVMEKQSYQPIPNELKIWYGDDYQCLYNQPYVIDGIDVITDMRTTSKTMNLTEQKRIEKEYWNKLKETLVL